MEDSHTAWRANRSSPKLARNLGAAATAYADALEAGQ